MRMRDSPERRLSGDLGEQPVLEEVFERDVVVADEVVRAVAVVHEPAQR